MESTAISREVLLVGPEAVALGNSLGQWLGEGCRCSTAQSLLEAVLISSNSVPLILVGVAQETDHLESGIRSLRGVNPDSQIVLLCEPADEAACRRALGWGADGYEILPLDRRSMQGLVPLSQSRPRREESVLAGPREQSPHVDRVVRHNEIAAVTEAPSIPLMVQTDMLEEILEGAGVRADFALRATVVLKRHLGIKGSLRFESGETVVPENANVHEFRRVVSFAGQAPYGALVWQPEQTPTSPPAASATHEAALLAQAANWLGAMLALSQRYEQLRTLAITDELSGAYNRRYFTKFMSGLLERAKESRFRVTLLLFDIDDFKKYNDTFGHASGDAIIRELIKLLRACTRPHDLVARVGGDEFAVVYWDNEAPRQPNSEHPKDVLVATERFREAIKNHQWPETCKIKGTISISGGLATFPWDADSLEMLSAKADEALLRAKGAGKNVIVMHARAGAPEEPAVRAS